MHRVLLLSTAVLLLLVAGCTSYVRLRGTSEIHDPSCRKVRNADPSGIVDADRDDGIPCLECLHEEAIEYEEDNR
jgi:hypothetical protein